MAVSLAYVAVYVLLVGIASFIEKPVGRDFAAVQLNVLIRSGSLLAAAVALIAVHGFAVPSARSVLAGLGIGLITGIGSLVYCFALDYLPVSLVVTLANLYIVITTLLGIAVLGEPVTLLKITGLTCMVTGVVVLGHTPTRYGINSVTPSVDKPPPVRAFVIMATYVVLIGVGAFLEKPALRRLDPTQLNGLMAIAMTAVAGIALAATGPGLPRARRTLGGIGVGIMVGIASVFYFLGLHGLPVSVAAATSNAYVVVTIALSSLLLRRPPTKAQSGAVAVVLLGATQLAFAAG